MVVSCGSPNMRSDILRVLFVGGLFAPCGDVVVLLLLFFIWRYSVCRTASFLGKCKGPNQIILLKESVGTVPKIRSSFLGVQLLKLIIGA